ncbi:MAG: hypothetical protein K6C36_02505 [Clostridia bacterium]|nr:hypothetical protein [Clostridia bacterium]
MKSRKLSPELTVFRSDLRRCWPVAVITFIFQGLELPVSLLYALTLRPIYAASATSPEYLGTIDLSVNALLSVLTSFVLVPAATLAVFDFMYSDRSAAAFFSLPIKRLRLFATKALTAASLVLVPNLIAFLCVLPMYSEPVDISLGTLAFCVLLIPLLFAAVAVFCMTVSGHPFSAALLYAVLNFAYIVTQLMLEFFGNNFIFGVSYSFNSDSLATILSPVAFVIGSFNGSNDLNGALPAAAAAGLIVLFAALSLFLFTKRKTERTEEMFVFRAAAVAARCAAAVYGGMLLSIILKTVFDITSVGIFACVFAFLSFIVYIAAEMIIKKQVRVFKPGTLLGWVALIACVFTAAAVGSVAAERYVPKASEIENAYIGSTYNATLGSEEELAEAVRIHGDIVANRSEYKRYYYDGFTDSGRKNISIGYKLKNGRVVRRSYIIPIRNEDGYTQNETYKAALTLMDDPDKLFFAVFGCAREHIRPVGCDVTFLDLLSDEDEQQYQLKAEKTGKLLDLIADYFKEPPRNMSREMIAQNIWEGFGDSPSVSFELTFRVADDAPDDFDWMDPGYGIYTETNEDGSRLSNSYFTFSTFCANDLIPAIEDLAG